MQKQEKILELFKIIFFLKYSFNLTQIYTFTNLKKKYLFTLVALKSKKKKKKINKFLRKVINRELAGYMHEKLIEFFGDKYFKYKIKKFIWQTKTLFFEKYKSKSKMLKNLCKYLKRCYCFSYFLNYNSKFKIKKFDFFIKKKLKIKNKSFKLYASYVIKKNDFYYLFYLYLNKKLMLVKSSVDFKNNKKALKRSRFFLNKVVYMNLLVLLKIYKIKKINLVMFMKKRRRLLNRKKYKKVTKTQLELKIFAIFYKTYKKLKKVNKNFVVKFKFIYARSHSKRTEKLKKRRRK